MTATAFQSVKSTDIVSPAYNAGSGPTALSMSALKAGTVNFRWNLKAGANTYIVRVEPLTAGAAPIWQSPGILATGISTYIPATNRIDLANTLAPYIGVVMKWTVYDRNQGDTSQMFLAGDQNEFVIEQ